MKLFELVLEDSDKSGVFAISLVDAPAMDSEFIKFSKNKTVIKFAETNKEKREVMGVVLIPDKPIYRKQDGNEFYVYMKAETIKKVSQKFMKQGNQGNATIEHNFEVEGVNVVESWIIEDLKFDKTRLYGIDAPINSWVVNMKIDNDDVWNNFVKTGDVKGFSIEALFKLKPTNIEMSLIELRDSFKKGTSE